MGSFDALIYGSPASGSLGSLVSGYESAAFQPLSVTVTRSVVVRSGGNSGGTTQQTIGTYQARIYRRTEQTINRVDDDPGAATVETNAVAVGIDYAGNQTSPLLINKGDIITPVAGQKPNDLSITPGVVERIRYYAGGVQINVRVGTV